MKNITTILKNLVFPSLGGARGGCRGMVCHIFFILSFFHSFIFTSCSSDPMAEEPEVKQVPIAFSGNMTEEEVTRAYTPLSEYITQFNVWGYKDMSEAAGVYSNSQMVFPGFIVDWEAGSAATTTTNTNGWEYARPDQNIKYWDQLAKAYRYFAISGWSGSVPTPSGWAGNEPATQAGYNATKTYGAFGTYSTYGAESTFEASMLADASSAEEMAKTPYFTRLWFSTGNPITYPDKQFLKPVVLEFLKPYSRVRFIFIYSYMTEGIKIKSKSFAPSNGDKIARKGIFQVTYPLTGDKTREWFSVTPDHDGDLTAFTTDYIPDGGPEKEVWYDVLPNNTQGTYTMSVRMNNDITDKTAVVPANYMQWQPGFSYTYIFKITEEGGVEIDHVETAAIDWIEREEDHEVYNW